MLLFSPDTNKNNRQATQRWKEPQKAAEEPAKMAPAGDIFSAAERGHEFWRSFGCRDTRNPKNERK